MKSFKNIFEEIFDVDNNLSDIDNTVHIKSIERAWHDIKPDWDKFEDHFGRALNVGDVVYSIQFGYVGVITNLYHNKHKEARVSADRICGCFIDDDDFPFNYILIPKSCTKEFIKVITAKK